MTGVLETALQAHAHGDVVCAARRAKLFQKPQTLLSQRQRGLVVYAIGTLLSTPRVLFKFNV